MGATAAHDRPLYNVVGLDDSTDIHGTRPCLDADAEAAFFEQAVKVVEYSREQVAAQDSVLKDAAHKVDDAAVVSVRSRKSHTHNALQVPKRLDPRASIHTSRSEELFEHRDRIVFADCGEERTTGVDGHGQRRHDPRVPK